MDGPLLASLRLGLFFVCIDAIVRLPWMRRTLCSLFGMTDEADTEKGKKLVGQIAARLVGSVFLIMMFPNASNVLQDPSMKQDLLYGTSAASRRCIAVASAYFFYDVYICITRYSENGLPFLIHGLLCSLAYTYPLLSGNMHYQGACFLMWELSTPFLYFRWTLIKTKRTDGILMSIANVLFALAFFGCRIVAGPLQSWEYYQASEKEIASRSFYQKDNAIPLVFLYAYRLAMVILNGLNYYWFYNIVRIALTSGKKNNVTETDVTPANRDYKKTTNPKKEA